MNTKFCLIASSLSLLAILSVGWGIEPMTSEDRLYQLHKRSIAKQKSPSERVTTSVTWHPDKTAVIVCDVWDYHHSINAVRRLEEMLPRMEALLKEARQRGSLIIHAPSDCMAAYADHPARKRAETMPRQNLPTEIASWCSKISAEQDAIYPIDQSDGGEDDDAAEHATWAAELKKMGRNPGMPWRTESPGLTIDADKDYISDRGDEVWAILKQKGIEHVMMIGVHTNMCVLGRPFGLRQMARNGMDVVLVRDLTDCMYNPQRWPYVDHFTGNDLLIGYLEQHICPTVTSDQILGGEPIRFRHDQRPRRDVTAAEVLTPKTPKPQWKLVTLGNEAGESVKTTASSKTTQKRWLRCALRFPQGSLESPATLTMPEQVRAGWLNGKLLTAKEQSTRIRFFEIHKEQTFGNDDANLLVLECEIAVDQLSKLRPPSLKTTKGEIELAGQWQLFEGPENAETNIPLPAKFGLSPEIFYSAQ